MMKNKKGFTPHLFQKDGVNVPVSLSRKKGAGFTLIELLIVIAIITILAAGVIVGINPARHFRNARNATRWNQMNAIATGVYSYAVDHGGTFPSCIPPAGNATTISVCTNDLVATYTSALPSPPQKDPPVNEVYMIERTGEGIKITSTAEEASGTVELIQ